MSRESRKNYLFLGFAIPDEEMEKTFKKDQFPQIQTHKFNWNLIKGLEYCDMHEFIYISARPINEYPHYQSRKIFKNNWNVKLEGKSISITEIPFYNKSLGKVVSRFFTSLYYGVRKYHKCRNKAGIIVYSVHVPFMLTGYILSKMYGIDFITIWTDPPSVVSEKESVLKRKLRKVEYKLSKFLMKRTDKVISLTRYLAEDFAPNKPYLVIEGIIDENDVNPDGICMKKYKKYRENKFESTIKVVYTGSLDKRYGIKNIVDAFKNLDRENITLEIYGCGDYEAELKTISCKDKIKYKGFVSNKEILNIQRKADFLINARSSEEEFVKYSFPSKTLEYMLSGTPLITTMLPGIPDEYKKYVIVLENNKPKTIEKAIKDIQNLDKNEINSIGNEAKAFALTKSYQIQGKRIIDFINS